MRQIVAVCRACGMDEDIWPGIASEFGSGGNLTGAFAKHSLACCFSLSSFGLNHPKPAGFLCIEESNASCFRRQSTNTLPCLGAADQTAIREKLRKHSPPPLHRRLAASAPSRLCIHILPSAQGYAASHPIICATWRPALFLNDSSSDVATHKTAYSGAP